MEAGCFVGTPLLGDTLVDRVLTVDTNHTPTAPSAAPTYTVYGPDGVVTTGTTTQVGAVTGLYSVSLICSTGNGYVAGQQYQVVFSYTVSAVVRGQVHYFQVG
jgi:hypothetical protein